MQIETVADRSEASRWRSAERRLRLLVAIASYGVKNIEFLKRIIRNYQNMDMDVSVFVLSEAVKDLGPSVKVIVGLPSKNPWSLPFAHKKLFVEAIDAYDLFIYSEDDMEVTAGNICAFLRITPVLDDDEIAGFLRYETDQSGVFSFPEVHGCYHWKADTVKRRGPYIVAEFSNEHSAFYILTQAQLRRAIASGGFLRAPYESRYDMLCTAATDPYTPCGFRKVICISTFNDFLIHHLPNRYVGQLGLQITPLTEQIQTLLEICSGMRPGASLCESESKFLHSRWSKSYYEEPSEELLSAVPVTGKRILSIGSGWGATEVELKKRGAEVTALPLDTVIGGATSRLGVEVIYGKLQEALKQLEGREFQLLLITNLLHLWSDPLASLRRCLSLIETGGELLISGPNFSYFPVLTRRMLGVGHYEKLRNFSASGINVLGAPTLIRQLKSLGWSVSSLSWSNVAWFRNRRAVQQFLGRWIARDWTIHAHKSFSGSAFFGRKSD